MNMKIIAIVLVVLGVVALFYKQITYTQKETVLDLGDLEVTTETKRSIPLWPIVGGVCVVAGVALLVTEYRKK